MIATCGTYEGQCRHHVTTRLRFTPQCDLHLLLGVLLASTSFHSVPVTCAQQAAQNSSPPQENPGRIGRGKLGEKPLEILGGRLTVRMPQGARIVKAKGYGITEKGGKTPVTAETLFQAGSVSKSVAAVGALHLVDKGKLSLDEDVAGDDL